jgi:RsiW-degrading membrane proteinase PrsW (M82 family)|tara:strand:+ start:2553 stop:3398 length:846 start_codon:yes stop_codon:yes gene_type:complete
MNFEIAILYLSTALPPIILGLIIWKSDRFQEPGKFLFASFLLGVAIVFPLDFLIIVAQDILAPLLNLDMESYKNWIDGGYKAEGAVTPVAERAYMNFFRAAFLEEGLKFALLIFFCVRLADLNEPMDAIVYGAAIGLGYAAVENLGYLQSASFENAWTMEMVKIRYYPLIMHMGFGVVMGLFLSQNLFEESSLFKRRLMLILSLIIPVIYHGVYNYYGTADIFPMLTAILVIGIIYYFRREQLKKITECIDKARIENIDVFYSYTLTLLLVILIVFSAIMF